MSVGAWTGGTGEGWLVVCTVAWVQLWLVGHPGGAHAGQGVGVGVWVWVCRRGGRGAADGAHMAWSCVRCAHMPARGRVCGGLGAWACKAWARRSRELDVRERQ